MNRSPGDFPAGASAIVPSSSDQTVVLGTAVTDATGAFRKSVTVPADLPAGSHSLVALGVDPSGGNRQMRLDVTVSASSATLPVTGFDVALTAIIGMVMTLAGMGFVGAGRRQRQRRSGGR